MHRGIKKENETHQLPVLPASEGQNLPRLRHARRVEACVCPGISVMFFAWVLG